MPEGHGVFGELTVRENLFMGAYPKRARSQERNNLERVLQLFPKPRTPVASGAHHERGRAANGGHRPRPHVRARRAAAGRAFAGSFALDGVRAVQALEQVRKADVTILLVEQNARRSLQLSDRGYLLEQGRIVERNSAAALLDDEAVRKAYLGG